MTQISAERIAAIEAPKALPLDGGGLGGGGLSACMERVAGVHPTPDPSPSRGGGL